MATKTTTVKERREARRAAKGVKCYSVDIRELIKVSTAAEKCGVARQVMNGWTLDGRTNPDTDQKVVLPVVEIDGVKFVKKMDLKKFLITTNPKPVTFSD